MSLWYFLNERIGIFGYEFEVWNFYLFFWKGSRRSHSMVDLEGSRFPSLSHRKKKRETEMLRFWFLSKALKNWNHLFSLPLSKKKEWYAINSKQLFWCKKALLQKKKGNFYILLLNFFKVKSFTLSLINKKIGA